MLAFSDESTPLHWAVYLGLPGLCAWLIDEGLYANQMSPIGTPLDCALLGHHAIHKSYETQIYYIGTLDPYPEDRQRLRVIQHFLEAGVQPDVKTGPGLDWLPLRIAICGENSEWCSALISAGARYSFADLDEIIQKTDFFVYPSMDCVLRLAQNDISVVLPEAYSNLFELAAFYIFNLGSYYNDLAEKLLIELSFQPEALGWACNLDPIQIDDTNVFSFYPLLKGMQRTLRSSEKFPSHLRAVLLEAVSCCNEEIVSRAVDECADTFLSLKHEGNSLLHIAISRLMESTWSAWNRTGNILETVKLLVKAGQSVSEPNYEGETPLHCAAKSGDARVFGFLLEAAGERNVLDAQTKTGLTAFDYALKSRLICYCGLD